MAIALTYRPFSNDKMAAEDQKKALLEDLSDVVGQLADKHRVMKNVASEEKEALRFVEVLEGVLLHGSLSPKGTTWAEEFSGGSSATPDVVSFWPFLEGRVSQEQMEKLRVLRYADSDVRRCRSWLRMVLNTEGWFGALRALTESPRALSAYYEELAYMRDPEKVQSLLRQLRRISDLRFQYNFTGVGMLSWSESTLQLGGILPSEEVVNFPDSDGRISPPMSDFHGLFEEGHHRQPSESNVMEESMHSMHYRQKEFEESYSAALEKYGQQVTQQKDPANPRSFREAGRQDTSEAKDGRREKEVETKVVAHLTVSEEYQLAEALDYEVVDTSFDPLETIAVSCPGGATLTGMLKVLTKEKGLDAQDYKCAQCKKPIGMIFNEAKICRYTSQYFCPECQLDDERIVPSRVLFSWDFRKHPVASHSAAFLDSIALEHVFDIKEINSDLYDYVPELEEVRKLRTQLHHLQNYILTCREKEVKMKFMRKLPQPHIYETVHEYSLVDLCKVENGQLARRLKIAVSGFVQHVLRCQLCSVKGFCCELCRESEVIYPFDLDHTHQCTDCRTVLHSVCWKKTQKCPRCERFKSRQKS